MQMAPLPNALPNAPTQPALPPQPLGCSVYRLEAVRRQVEYYFSAVNLCRDMYPR